MTASTVNIVSTTIFALAVLHTFSTKFFEHLAHTSKDHSGFWHLLGEVEVVFGFWAMVLVCFLFLYTDKSATIAYLEGQNYTEPLFVFVVMVISASKPIFTFCLRVVGSLGSVLPVNRSMGFFFVTMGLVPLLGSFITEPAAMTLAALLLKENFYDKGISNRLRYATIGVLFVNISIGGTLTPYAAPPILMVASKWNWDMAFMLTTFGWRSALAVTFNALVLTWMFRSELKAIEPPVREVSESMPMFVVVVHLMFLAGVVISAHHAVLFIGLFLFFVGFTTAYARYQNRLLIRESLLVGFFLAGLVILGGQQKWWLQPLLASLDPTVVYYGATALTAITDNAALTFLGSLVEGLTPEFKYALVAGAVTGGGLTVIANAPNPAGFSILRGNFHEGAINPFKLFAFALPPTLVAVVCFQWL
jgi:Putative Na+/H+ antiporter